MLGVLGPRGQRLAAKYADIWSVYAEKRSDMVEFGPRLAGLEVACAEVGRDPKTIGRSAGVDTKPLEKEPHAEMAWISGSPEQVADQIRAVHDGGFTQIELFISPPTLESIEACAPVLELLRADAA